MFPFATQCAHNVEKGKKYEVWFLTFETLTFNSRNETRLLKHVYMYARMCV